MSVLGLYLSDVTPDEAAAGFGVCAVAHPDGASAAVPAVVYTWGDPSHRLVKTSGRDGQVIFQLQAFGRRKGDGPPGWFAERFWPGQYGPTWVLVRLREHIGRPEYAALIELHIPLGDDGLPAPAALEVTVSGPSAGG
jgi:hypothetical protein